MELGGLDRKKIEWNRENNVEHMWEQVKRAMVVSTREMCDSMRVGREGSRSVFLEGSGKSCG